METRAQLGAMPRTLIVLATLALLTALAAGAIVIGSSANVKLPPPFGPARNGLIAYATGGDVWLVSPDGQTTTQLTSGPGLKRDPAWSRDGTRLAYSSLVGNEYALHVINADGTAAHAVANGLASDPGLAEWRPDGSAVAFNQIDESLIGDECGDVYSGACGSRIWVAAADGSGSEQVGPADLDAYNAVWSPDGSSLAFAGRIAAGQNEAFGLYVMAADGTNVRRLGDISGPPGRALYWNAWSPDGTRIATQTIPHVVEVVDVETGEASVVASGPSADFSAWSPDGTELAVSGWMVGGAIVGADGVERTIDAVPVGHLHWSPDGTMLVGVTEYQPEAIYLLDLDGNPLTMIETPGRGTGTSDFQRLAQ